MSNQEHVTKVTLAKETYRDLAIGDFVGEWEVVGRTDPLESGYFAYAFRKLNPETLIMITKKVY